eukprot:363422-Chlamydomonas_euryale.AAC.5
MERNWSYRVGVRTQGIDGHLPSLASQRLAPPHLAFCMAPAIRNAHAAQHKWPPSRARVWACA